MRSECYTTNLLKVRPPNNWLGAFIAPSKKAITSAHTRLRDKWVTQEVQDGFSMLKAEIKAVQPQVIIAFGNTALWGLTGHWGISKWRASHLQLDALVGSVGPTVLPTFHPAAILREWYQRPTVINDLRRAKRIADGRGPTAPEWKFTLRPNFTQVLQRLNSLYRLVEDSGVWIDFDLETRAGHIACAGLSWSKTEAICIPFMERGRPEGYWNLEEEAHVVWWLWKVLCHPKALIRGQNLLYDCQYTWRWWHFLPRVKQDTMISQHTLFGDMPKSLAFQASMYADWYVFWKDEAKTI
jgi:hypothetical protein